MWYQKEYNFMQNILKKQNIQIRMLEKNISSDNPVDLGIRHILNRETEYNHVFCELVFNTMNNMIYKLTDQYMCNYFYLQLPGKNQEVLIIGPYMSVQLTSQQLLEEMEHYSTNPNMINKLLNYYESIPVLSDEIFLFTTIICFAEVIWKGLDTFSVVKIQDDDVSQSSILQDNLPDNDKELLQVMEQMEHRYAYENELLDAVSLGLTHKAELMLSRLGQYSMRQRVSDPIRNMKNYSIIMNTLMRKAAEKGSVHPMYLDRISTEFAKKIEMIISVDAAAKLMAEMLTSYCRLVNKYAMKSYSLPIQKTIVCIDANLSSDLALHTLASLQNLSSAYLSSLFKKETGHTLTDYVNSQRMKYASKLLSTTALQIQTISQYCGMRDLNYFIKVFKHYYECTPTDYRKSHQFVIKH